MIGGTFSCDDPTTKPRRDSRERECADCPTLIVNGNRCGPCSATRQENLQRDRYQRIKSERIAASK